MCCTVSGLERVSPSAIDSSPSVSIEIAPHPVRNGALLRKGTSCVPVVIFYRRNLASSWMGRDMVRRKVTSEKDV